jgi:CHAT domain-containing protein
LLIKPDFLREKSFRAALERIWSLDANDNDIKIVGSKLFDALFPQEAFHILRNSLEQVQREGKKLRLILHLDSPELVRLPWELMRSAKLPPGRLIMNQHLSLIRYLPLAQPIRRKPYRVPLDVLVLVSSPAGLPPLDVTSEQAKIKKSLRLMTWGKDVRLRFCEHATLDKLRSELERGADVVHFIGHGDFDEKSNSSSLQFECEDGERDAVSAEALGEVLHDSTVRLVVLNSCESAASAPHNAFTGVAQELLRSGVPAVVAMQFKILDSTAPLFSETFYSALITNYSIEAAVAAVRLRLMAGAREDLLGWATPVLYMRGSDGGIFKMER